MRSQGAIFMVIALTSACVPQKEMDLEPQGYSDNFDRVEIGTNWNTTSGRYYLADGALRVQGAHNHPIWLRRCLPKDVSVAFDVISQSPSGDIKWELGGDGVSWAKSLSYKATGYVFVLGGWNNSLNIIARQDEHGDDRTVGPPMHVAVNQHYHITLEKKGGHIQVWVNGQKLMERNDTRPFQGPGHDHFAFNNWESSLIFDNLYVRPL